MAGGRTGAWPLLRCCLTAQVWSSWPNVTLFGARRVTTPAMEVGKSWNGTKAVWRGSLCRSDGKITIGVCAREKKAMSKHMQAITSRFAPEKFEVRLVPARRACSHEIVSRSARVYSSGGNKCKMTVECRTFGTSNKKLAGSVQDLRFTSRRYRQCPLAAKFTVSNDIALTAAGDHIWGSLHTGGPGREVAHVRLPHCLLLCGLPEHQGQGVRRIAEAVRSQQP